MSNGKEFAGILTAAEAGGTAGGAGAAGVHGGVAAGNLNPVALFITGSV